MSDLWESVRAALASKMAASSGMAAAGLRSASAAVDDVGDPPFLRVLPCSFDFTNGDANEDDYLLTFPFELVVAQPTGRTRSDPTGQAIVRALQVELRTGVQLGLGSSGVIDARLLAAAPGLDEYAPLGMNGYRGTIVVQVHETGFTRTA